jgi:Zn-dependent protease with chaperone function
MSQPAIYRHTQFGKIIWLALIIAFVVSIIAVTLAGAAAVLTLAVSGLLILLIGWIFGSLKVAVAGGDLSWWFGPGFWKKRVAIDEIEVCEAVRNRWWWGWGIRYYVKGWLYNVSRLDAVEITLKTGKRIRIGTDEPEALVAAIRSVPVPKSTG